jgi:hypothetical protein
MSKTIAWAIAIGVNKLLILMEDEPNGTRRGRGVEFSFVSLSLIAIAGPKNQHEAIKQTLEQQSEKKCFSLCDTFCSLTQPLNLQQSALGAMSRRLIYGNEGN